MRYLNWQRKCLITTFLIISSLLLVFSSITYANESKSEDSLKITTHNVYFLPTALYPNWGQSQRADLISKADYIQGQDVVILMNYSIKSIQSSFNKFTISISLSNAYCW